MLAKVMVPLLLLLPQFVWGVQPLPVTTATLKSLLFYPTRTAPASVVSRNNSKISAEVSAVITRIPVEVGQIVEPDTPLVELRETEISLAIREAESTLKSLQAQSEQAIDQLQRVRSLANTKSVTAELFSQRETEVKVAAAAVTGQHIRVEKLRLELSKTIARAPFKAIVVEQIANVGELAMPGTPLVQVMDATNVEVVAELQPYDVPSLTQASSTVFVTNNKEYPVHLKQVIPVIDERERNQEVRLEFAGDGALIGANGRLIWRENQPHLPADYLVQRDGILGIFLVNDGSAKFMNIPNAEEGRPFQNRLPLDTTLIIDGRFVIQDGQLVNIKPEQMDRQETDKNMEPNYGVDNPK